MPNLLSTEGVIAGCALLDPSTLAIVWTNDRFEELLPADAPRPIVGHHIRDASPYIETLGITARLERVASSGEQLDMDTVSLAREGERAVHWKRSAYRLPSGDVLFVVERIATPADNADVEI